MKSIMVVDDEVNVLSSLRRVLRGYAWDISFFSCPFEALKVLNSKSIDLVLSDFQMPQMDGVTFLNRVREIQPNAMRVILSGHADLNRVLDAINRAEVYRFITKPWNNEALRISISQALDVGALLQENKQLAELIREQGTVLKRQLAELQKIKEKHPEIARVEWDEDGCIDLSEEFDC